MSRVGYLYLPGFLLGLIRSGQPQLMKYPLLLYREGRVLAFSPELQERACPGMTIGLASGRCPEAVAVELGAEITKTARESWLNDLVRVSAAVEPVGEEESFFIPADFYGQSISQSLRHQLRNWGGIAGIGTSKMVARLAAHSLLGHKKTGKFMLREIKAGEEADFLRPFFLDQDIFLPLIARHFFQSIGVNTFAEAQQLSQSDLLSLLGEQAYRVHLHCQGRDQLPVIGSYPPQQITVGFSCLPEENLDTFQLHQRMEAGIKMLAAKLQERNCGCRRLVLILCSAGKQFSAERTLTAGRQQEKSLGHLFTFLADQLTCPEAIDQLVMKVGDLYPLNYVEQDLFNPRVINSGTAGITEVQEAVLARWYPGAVASWPALNLREAALAQFDPWRGSQSELLRGESGVCSPAHS